MRRLRRHLFTLCSSASLVLLVAVGVVWVRSYWWTDQVVWTRVDGNRFLQSARGYLWAQMYLGDLSELPRDDFGLQYRRFEPNAPPHSLMSFYGPDRRFVGGTSVRWAGFEWYTLEDRDGIVVATGVARCSSIALATAVLPVVWATLRTRSYVRQRR